jgi:glycosyltransferase involved in cell wall biosynthesis
MRISLITHYYPPEIGAGANRMSSLVERWTQLGAEVTVIAPVPHYPFGTRLPGSAGERLWRRHRGVFGEVLVRVPYFPSRRGGLPKLIDQLVAGAASIIPVVTAVRPDVIMATVPAMPSMVTAVAGRARWGAPMLLDLRDSWPDLIAVSGAPGAMPARLLVRSISALQRNSDAIVTVQRSFGDDLARRGIDRARIYHVPNGINPDAVPVLPPPPRGREPLNVLYLGTHGVSQGLETPIEALAQLGPGVVQARFIGDGTEKVRLERVAAELGAPIVFEEPATGARLWEAYGWADTCLVPLRPWSLLRDAVPSKLYEVLACGRHVTASLEGDAVGIVRESGGGAAVAPGDVGALVATLQHLAAHRQDLMVGTRPREWVMGNRNRAILAEKYLAIIEEVATRGRIRGT